MDDIITRQVNVDTPEYEQVWELREALLRKPIGLSLKDEDLSDDAKDIILIAEKGGKVVGCLMLQPKTDVLIKFRQMAVYHEWQGKGIGAQLMHAAEHIAVMHGYKQVVLHARITAKDFYAGLDYIVTSDVFTEVGIDHVVMEKKLTDMIAQ